MTTHPDDETDDVEVLRDNLQRLRKTVEDWRLEVTHARALVESMKEQLVEEGEHWERMSDLTAWVWDSTTPNLWRENQTLIAERDKAVTDFNRLIPEYNAMLRDTPPKAQGRPLGATEEQAARVRQLRTEGCSLRGIVARTDLSLRTVRTIVTGPQKAKEARQLLVRRHLNKEAARRYRAANKLRDSLPNAGKALERKRLELIREAKRF